jgi:hypothetical protein
MSEEINNWEQEIIEMGKQATSLSKMAQYVDCVRILTSLITHPHFKDLHKKYQAKAYNDRGYGYEKQELFDKAIDDYSTAIELNPNDAVVYNNRGIAYGMQGKLNEAIVDFSKTIELDPKYAEAYYNRGKTYYDLNQFDASISDYYTAIKLDSKYEMAYINVTLLLVNKRSLGEKKNFPHATLSQSLGESKAKEIEQQFDQFFSHPFTRKRALFAYLCSYFKTHGSPDKKNVWETGEQQLFSALFSNDILGHQSINPSPTLYKFKPFNNFLIRELVMKQLFLAKPDQWNDPFDGRMFESFRVHEYEQQFKRLRMQSFSVKRTGDSTDDPSKEDHPEHPIKNVLMWSHYADQHQGVCLVYAYQDPEKKDPTKPKAFLHTVRYSEQAKIENSNDLFLQKSKQWRYENEYRLVYATPEEADQTTPTELSYASIGIQLTAIYFGEKCTAENRHLVGMLLNQYEEKEKPAESTPKPRIFEVKRKPMSFELEATELEWSTAEKKFKPKQIEKNHETTKDNMDKKDSPHTQDNQDNQDNHL